MLKNWRLFQSVLIKWLWNASFCTSHQSDNDDGNENYEDDDDVSDEDDD